MYLKFHQKKNTENIAVNFCWWYTDIKICYLVVQWK